MATENILMHCVKAGGDRQTLHEAIRRHSVDAGKRIKTEGGDNDLLDRIASDPVFGLTREDINAIIKNGRFTGRAEEQTEEYLSYIRGVLADNSEAFAGKISADVNV